MRMRVLGPSLLLLAACGVDEAVHKATLDNLKRCESDLQETAQKLATRDKESAELRAKLDAVEGEKGSLAARLGATQQEVEELRRAREAAEKRSQTYRELMAKLRSMIDAGQLKVETRKGKMIVKLSDKILFDPGKTLLKPEGQEALRQLAAVLRDIPDRDFLVAGHTDNVPIRSPKFGSNWELSAARAVEVVRFLQAEGLNPAHLGAAGFSEFDAVGDNADDAGRAQNRRIEVVLMPNIEELPQIAE